MPVKEKLTDAYVVSFDIAQKSDVPCCVVTKNIDGRQKIINAVYGDEAVELYNKLILNGKRVDLDDSNN